MLPSSIPQIYFNQFNKLVKDFLWDGKRPRIIMARIYDLKENGGLGLPDVEVYNISFELSVLVDHWETGGENVVGWTKLEEDDKSESLWIVWQKDLE